MRELERDGAHIWLRQSATFTVNGQTRTVEIAIPLPPGASEGEIEALLRQAHTGMARLSRDLDAQVAAVVHAEGHAVHAAIEAPSVAAPAHAESAAAEPAAPHIAEEPAAVEELPAPAPTAAPAQPQRPTRPTPAPTTAPAASQPPAPARAEPAPAAAARARPSGPLLREAPAEPPTPAPVAGPPMDLREFLSAARNELELLPPQIMSRLGVRTLSGLNYREALETLRRQMLRDGAGSAAATAATTSPARPATPPATAVAPVNRNPEPALPPRYFEEELDEPEIVFSVEDAEGGLGDEFATGAPPGENDYDDFGLDEDDVPDFGPPPAPARSRPAPTRAATPARPASAARAPEPAPELPAAPAAAGAEAAGERSRGVQLLGQLRSATAGGTPSTYQRTAFRNIVSEQLGPEKTRALAQGLYRVPPERLGPEQLDALISWGKQDSFAEDADLVLAALRSERERATNAANAPAAPASNGTSPRPPARGRGASSRGTEEQ